MLGLNEIISAIRKALVHHAAPAKYEPGDTLLVNKYIEESMLYGVIPDNFDPEKVCGHHEYESTPTIH